MWSQFEFDPAVAHVHPADGAFDGGEGPGGEEFVVREGEGDGGAATGAFPDPQHQAVRPFRAFEAGEDGGGALQVDEAEGGFLPVAWLMSRKGVGLEGKHLLLAKAGGRERIERAGVRTNGEAGRDRRALAEGIAATG